VEEARILVDLAGYHDAKAAAATSDEARADHVAAALGCRKMASWWLARIK